MSRIASLVTDAVLVVVFAVIGMSSHSETLSAAGIWHTAWPFLAGAAIGWVVVLITRRPGPGLLAGGIVWVSTVVLGLIFRHLSNQGLSMPFPIIAAVVLAVFLLGWRFVARLMMSQRARRPKVGV
ncbi:MAG: DUF3054 domain-containing protein [Antricoccus sp.]